MKLHICYADVEATPPSTAHTFWDNAMLNAADQREAEATEVLVLPQRQPTLVAKPVSTLDTLSGGRVRRRLLTC